MKHFWFRFVENLQDFLINSIPLIVIAVVLIIFTTILYLTFNYIKPFTVAAIFFVVADIPLFIVATIAGFTVIDIASENF